MAKFKEFKKATQAKAPQILAAEIADAQAEAHANALRNKTIIDAAGTYNVGTGDNSPITDYLGSLGEGGAEVATPEMIAAPTAETAATVVPSGGENLLAETLAGAGGSGGAAGGEALAAEALGSGVLEGAGGAALETAVAPVVAEGAGATALGTAGAVLPPLLMAGLLSRALGMWS